MRYGRVFIIGLSMLILPNLYASDLHSVYLTEEGEPKGIDGFPNEAPRVFLNHFYVVVDTETYEAIGRSRFLKEQFATFSQDSMTTGDNQSWSGTYLEGEHTYMEFFGETADKPAGSTGIGLGVDQIGDIGQVEDKLNNRGITNFQSSLMTSAKGKTKIPWFHFLKFIEDSGPFACEYWIMEYHRDYLHQKHPDLIPEGSITRKLYQAKHYNPSKCLKEVVGLTLAFYPEQRKKFLCLLSALDYTVTSDKGVYLAKGPGIEFRIIEASWNKEGVREVQLSLTGKGCRERRAELLGHSTLEIHGDNRATWLFRDAEN